MARTLTTKYVDSVERPAAGRIEIFDAATPGLALRVTDKGIKSWSVMYRHAGALRRDTIGRYPALGVREARRKAAERLELAGRGTDPRQEDARQAAQEAARRGQTVAIAAEAFIVGYCADRPSWRDLESITRNEIVGAWRDRPLSEITRQDAARLLMAIKLGGKAGRRSAPVRANRVCAVIKLFFRWCVAQDFIQASPMVALEKPTKERGRDRVLTHDEIRAFWNACDRAGWPFGRIGQLLLLTAQRRQEIGGLGWPEIDGGGRLIAIPAERYKGGRAHLVPLPAPALAIIEDLEHVDGTELVFPSAVDKGRPCSGYPKAHARLLRFTLEELRHLARDRGEDPTRVQLPRFWFHDLRRTARTEMSRIGIPWDTAERVLGHALGDLRGRYDRYAYLDEKRDALERLGAHIMEIVGSRSS